MNKKPTILAVAALGSLALIGTGFAGWVITQEASAAQSGNIQAMAVTDGRVSVSISAFNPTAINFGKPTFDKTDKSEEISGAWFKFESGDTADVLVATATITVEYNTHSVENRLPVLSLASFGVYTETLADQTVTARSSIHEGAWGTALSKKVIADPTYSVTAFNRDSTDKYKLTATLTVTFGYGQKFNNDNPYWYYNASAYTSDLAADATEYGNYVGALNGAKFNLNFTAVDGGENAANNGINGTLTATAAGVPALAGN